MMTRVKLCQLVFVNLTQTRITWEEETSIEEVPLSASLGMSVVHFHN